MIPLVRLITAIANVFGLTKFQDWSNVGFKIREGKLDFLFICAEVGLGNYDLTAGSIEQELGRSFICNNE